MFIVEAALNEIRSRQIKIKEEQDTIFNQNRIFLESSHELSGIGLRAAVLAELTRQSDDYAERMNKFSEMDQSTVPYCIKTNKMPHIFGANYEMFSESDESVVFKYIAGGGSSIGNDILSELPLISDHPPSTQYWGTSAVTFTSHALLTVHCALGSGKSLYNCDSDSAIIYKARYGGEVLAFVHSGYAFGGHREAAIQQKFGPEDCSSWVAKITGCPELFSTADQLQTQRVLEGEEGFVQGGWQSSQAGRAMLPLYTQAIKSSEVKPGDIFVQRAFEPTKDIADSSNLGVSGHTGFVLERSGPKSLLCVSYTRDMPYIEGFGISEVPDHEILMDNGRQKKIMFQRSEARRS